MSSMSYLRSRAFVHILVIIVLLAGGVFSLWPVLAHNHTGIRSAAAQAPAALVLNERFDAALAIPNGWNVVNNIGTTGWRVEADGTGGNKDQNKNDTGGTQNFAVADSDESRGAMDTELRSPTLNLATAQRVQLKFKTRFEDYNVNATTEKADVDVSGDGGTTWQNVWRKTTDYTGSETVDITAQAAGKAAVIVRFRYYDANFDYFWKIDDVQIDTTTAAAVAPTGLTATADGQTRINLAWTDNSNNEPGFTVERSPNGNDGWVAINQTAANVTAFTDTNLTCGTTYHYRVRTRNTAGAAVSNVANAATAACPTGGGTAINESFDGTALPNGWSLNQIKGDEPWRFNNPYNRENETNGAGGFATADSDRRNVPGLDMDAELRTPPLNFTGKNAIRMEFQSRLQIAKCCPTNASVAVSTDGGTTWNAVWQSTEAHTRKVTLDISPQAANQPNVLVRFRYVANDSFYWQIDNVKIEPLPLPAAPTALKVTLGDNSEPLLAWTGNGAQRFEVWRSTAANANGTKIADVANGATTYVDNGAASNTTYFYRVRAVNASGPSEYSAAAQTQTGDRTKRFFDLTISLYRPAAELTPALRQRYDENIRYFADAVYEMSNGAHFLRRVEFLPNGAAADTADVKWITECHPRAHVSGYGKPGQRITMCDRFGTQDYLQNPRLGGWGSLGHEWGHYAYSLYDEYKGRGACDPADPGGPCNTDIPVDPSIMHQGDFADSRNDLNWLNLSYVGNNTRQTAQHRVYAASGWETVARPLAQDPRDGLRNNRPVRLYYPELAQVAPTGTNPPRIDLDINNLNNSPGRQALNIVWKNLTPAATLNSSLTQVGAGSVQYIVLDRSAATLSTEGLAAIKAALHQKVDRIRFGDTLGILAYDSSVTTILPITLIDSPVAREAAYDAIDTITLGDDQTATGTALQTALDDLNASINVAEQSVAVYLLSGGQTSTGPFPSEIVPAYQQDSVEVYTFYIGLTDTLGNQAGAAVALRQIARQTNGNDYSTGANRNALNMALASADSLSSDVVDLVVNQGYVEADPDTTVERTFTVDPSLAYLEVEVDWFGPPTWADVTLVNPNGDTTPLDDCEVVDDGGGPGADKNQQTICFVSIETPAAGTWTLQVTATSDVADFLDLFYWIGAGATPGVETFSPVAEVITDAAENVVSFPEPVVINALVNYQNGMIAGAVVTATVDAPDGSFFDITLRDDGANPDDLAGDGRYAGIFAPTVNGTYDISVFFNGQGDTTVSFTGLTDTEDLDPFAVNEQFQRVAYQEVTMTNAPANIADSAAGPAVTLTPDNTPVPGRINGADDFTVYTIAAPADDTTPLVVRVDNLALGMDPLVIAYNEAGTWEREEYLETEPTMDDFLAFEVFAEPGERIFFEVMHFDPEATQGTYDISVGPQLAGDIDTPLSRADAPKSALSATRLYLPFVKR